MNDLLQHPPPYFSRAFRRSVAAVVVLLTVVSVQAVDPSGATASTRCPAHAKRAYRIVGPLHVCGTTIRDRYGRFVRLNSISMNAFGTGDGQNQYERRFPPSCSTWSRIPKFPPNGNGAYQDIRKWGFNAVELFVSWANLENAPPTISPTGKLVHHWNYAYLKALEEAVGRFRRAGVAVILMMLQSRWSPAFTNMEVPGGAVYPCGAGMPGWLYPPEDPLYHNPTRTSIENMVAAQRRFYDNEVNLHYDPTAQRHIQQGFANAWSFLARRFRNNPAVVAGLTLFESYDLLARSDYPGTAGVTARSLKLASFNERVARAMHEGDPNLLILYGDHYKKDTGKWALLRRPRIPNGVYTFELYAIVWLGEDKGKERLSLYYDRARRWRYPPWINEWSMFNRTFVGFEEHATWKRDTKAMMNWMRERKMGFNIYGYDWGSFQVMGRRPYVDFAPLRKPQPFNVCLVRFGSDMDTRPRDC